MSDMNQSRDRQHEIYEYNPVVASGDTGLKTLTLLTLTGEMSLSYIILLGMCIEVYPNYVMSGVLRRYGE
jgi:hypothetical protein